MALTGWQAELMCGFSLGSVEVAQYDFSTYILVEFLVFRVFFEFQ